MLGRAPKKKGYSGRRKLKNILDKKPLPPGVKKDRRKGPGIVRELVTIKTERGIETSGASVTDRRTIPYGVKRTRKRKT